jgi:AcrR family transcriptional regulator
MPPTRADQKAATREKLVRVARRLFTRNGFSGTSIGQICAAARVTHGALYHHFPGKTEIFAAVLDELHREVAAAVSEAAAKETGFAQVEAAFDAYLGACTDPSFRAIVLRDGPSVLSRADFDRVDHGVNAPFVTGLLERWIDEGIFRPLPVELTARVLGGAFAEAGAAIAEAERPAHVRRELAGVFALLVHGLRASE